MADPVRRVHFFVGQILTAEDLQAEQDYHREMRYLHNRILGSGVVRGLEISVADGSTVRVGPGVGIDPRGREIVLVEDVRIDLGTTMLQTDASVHVTATWEQVPDGFAVGGDGGRTQPDFARWIERPCLTLEPPDQPPPQSLSLARLTRMADGTITIDCSTRSVWRPPSGAVDD